MQVEEDRIERSRARKRAAIISHTCSNAARVTRPDGLADAHSNGTISCPFSRARYDKASTGQVYTGNAVEDVLPHE